MAVKPKHKLRPCYCRGSSNNPSHLFCQMYKSKTVWSLLVFVLTAQILWPESSFCFFSDSARVIPHLQTCLWSSWTTKVSWRSHGEEGERPVASAT